MINEVFNSNQMSIVVFNEDFRPTTEELIYLSRKHTIVCIHDCGDIIPYFKIFNSITFSNQSDLDNLIDKVGAERLKSVHLACAHQNNHNNGSIENNYGLYPSMTSLSNKYVVSICFRNQDKKIKRCLDSVIRAIANHDVGVVIINDASDDESDVVVQRALKNSGIQYIYVKNENKKGAAYNFYRTIHKFIDSKDTYVIELDGDDYLYTNSVFDVLDEKLYGKYLKGIGGMISLTDSGFSEKRFSLQKKLRDVSNVWNVNKFCSWYPLRCTHISVLKKIEIEHFKERLGGWLSKMHDMSIHSRATELCATSVLFIDDILYCYDQTGIAHDSYINDDDVIDWSEVNYHIEEPYLDKLFGVFLL